MIEKQRQYNPSRTWNLLLNHIKDDKPLTTFEVSRICGVNHASVSHWIDQNKLNAFRTPGGHRRVKCADLLIFLKVHQIPVPKALESSMTDTESPQIENLNLESEAKLQKVLVVVRENPTREVLFQILQRSYPQYEFHMASDLYTFGKKVGRIQPDCVIMDLNLEGSDSSRILENIRTDKELSNTRIIVIIENRPLPKYQKMVSEFSVDGYIIKPVKVDELKDKLNHALSQGHAQS